MLLELRVENLLIIEQARLRLAPGLNVVTGETGAGKTVLAEALALLRGEKPRKRIVRPGADEAYVEGIFLLSAELARDQIVEEICGPGLSEGDEVVLARRIYGSDRSRAFVDGRTASVDLLTKLGNRLLTFCGQHEHRNLTSSSQQLRTVDAYCGEKHLKELMRYGEDYTRRRGLEAELEELTELAARSERELEFLNFEIDEIEKIAPQVDEDSVLKNERERLAHYEALSTSAQNAALALESDDSEPAAATLMREAGSSLTALAGVDQELDALAERYDGLIYEAGDLARALRSYGSGLEGDPQRLYEIEQRLDSLEQLKRKHGGSLESALEALKKMQSERDRLQSAELDLDLVTGSLQETHDRLEKNAGLLTRSRRAAAKKLGQAIGLELQELGMPAASFEVQVVTRAEDDRYGPHGQDQVQFTLAANPGVAAAALGEVASGGELSRLMLAIMSVAATRDSGQTLVFDEIDAGVGGATARAVGERLRNLTEVRETGRQIICITHLPQIASLAGRHFSISKETNRDLATTSVEVLEEEQLVAELCRMLGADVEDEGARRHAQDLLAAA